MDDNMDDNIKLIQLGGDTYKDIGINILTGEACALSMRLLCEVTKNAMKLYIEYTGMQIDIDTVPGSQWNHHNRYSVFMTWQIINDLVIMHYAKLGYSIAKMESEEFHSGEYLLISMDNQELRDYINSHSEIHKCNRYYIIYNEQPHRGLSNIHAFSGMNQ